MRPSFLRLLPLLILGLLLGCVDDVEPYEEGEVIDDDDVEVADGMETGDGVFRVWDYDGNEYISNEEYDAGYRETGLFDRWDADDDALLTTEEYGAGYVGSGFGEAGDFEAYDTNADGFLSETELYEGSYAAYDTDRDMQLSADEFGPYESRFDVDM